MNEEIRKAFESHRNPKVLKKVKWDEFTSEYIPRKPHSEFAKNKAAGFNASLWGFQEGYFHQENRIRELEKEVERLKGIKPGLEFNQFPLPRFGIRWNGPKTPLAVPMDDGYWTPFHVAERLISEVLSLYSLAEDGKRYQSLINSGLICETCGGAGFVGSGPDNYFDCPDCGNNDMN